MNAEFKSWSQTTFEDGKIIRPGDMIRVDVIDDSSKTITIEGKVITLAAKTMSIMTDTEKEVVMFYTSIVPGGLHFIID